jgi:hypothetical protein
MHLDKNKTYVGRDFDKMTLDEYAEFGVALEQYMNEVFTRKEIERIQQSDIIATNFLKGGAISQEDANFVLKIQKLYNRKLPEAFRNSMLNYYKNKHFRANIHIN